MIRFLLMLLFGIVPAVAGVPGQIPGRTVTIVMVGDSTMYGDTCADNCLPLGNGTYVQAVTNEPAVIQLLANSDFGAGVVTVINGGIGGSTCRGWWYGPASGSPLVPYSFAQLLAGGQDFSAYPALQAAGAALPSAQMIVNNCGLNDAGLIAPGGGETAADFSFQVNQMAYAAQQAGKTYIIETPNCVIDSTINDLAGQITQLDVTAAVARGAAVANQWVYDQTVTGWTGMLPDGVHPNEWLYLNKAVFTYASAVRPVATWWLTH